LLLASLLPRAYSFAPIVSQPLSRLSSHQKKSFTTLDDMADSEFVNATEEGEIPTFGSSDKAKATDFANYFCSYAQLYHQKQMLADHNRMAAYHAAIMGNPEVFKDKVVMDVGTGSGILAAWAAQAGAKRVYAIEYTDMAKHARSVMEANGLADIVTVIQGAVEDVELPIAEHGLTTEDGDSSEHQVVDIIISEWMGYFLLRESMLDSLVRARDKFLKPKTGLMLPSHTTMFLAPINDEEERRISNQEYNGAMGEWSQFAETTQSTYGVDMSVLTENYEREQKEYFLLSSRWAELPRDAVMATPVAVKHLDMATCTLADSKGIMAGDEGSTFDFEVNSEDARANTISGFAGWFDADFKSRTDEGGANAPKIPNPAYLTTGPEAGYTHWGQQTFHTMSSIPLIKGETTRIQGALEMTRSKDNARLYNCRIRYNSERRKTGEDKDGNILNKGYQVKTWL
jgi:protein arginine N-methyltransferase 1